MRDAMKTIQMMVVGVLAVLMMTTMALAAPPVKSKFYNFKNQLFDGRRAAPVVTLINPRERVKFERLLKLKKSFMRSMYQTQKERVFK
jgi:hypothetical protein